MILNIKSILVLFLLASPIFVNGRRRHSKDVSVEQDDDECSADENDDDDDEEDGDNEYDDDNDNDRTKKPKRKAADLTGDILKDGYAEEDEEKIPDQGGKCPEGWKAFNRVRGKWCIKVFAKEVDQPDAQEACAAEGGRLTSVETKKEKDFIHKKALEMIVPTGPFGQEYIYIGANRRQDCYDINKITCLPYEVNTYYWSDDHATGKRQFDFGCQRSGNEECVVFSVQSGPVGEHCLLPGMLKQHVCSIKQKGFACGKEATK